MPGPIRHIVMWRLRGDTAEERAAARLRVKDAFEGPDLIKGLNHIEVGLDVSTSITPATSFSRIRRPRRVESLCTHRASAGARGSVTYGSGAFRSTIRSRGQRVSVRSASNLPCRVVFGSGAASAAAEGFSASGRSVRWS